jgi:hypothetical protein
MQRVYFARAMRHIQPRPEHILFSKTCNIAHAGGHHAGHQLPLPRPASDLVIILDRNLDMEQLWASARTGMSLCETRSISARISKHT